jgi:hypothetical protein
VCREKIPQFVYSQLSFVSCSIKTFSSTLCLNNLVFSVSICLSSLSPCLSKSRVNVTPSHWFQIENMHKYTSIYPDRFQAFVPGPKQTIPGCFDREIYTNNWVLSWHTPPPPPLWNVGVGWNGWYKSRYYPLLNLNMWIECKYILLRFSCYADWISCTVYNSI